MGARRFLLLSVAAWLAGFALQSCDSAAGAGNPEEQRNLLIMLSAVETGRWDFDAACQRAVGGEKACVESAGLSEVAYLTALESRIGTKPTAADSVLVCPAYHASPMMKNFGAVARTCYFRCELDYWNNGLASGRCQGATYPGFAAAVPGNIAECINSCLRSDETTFYF